MTSHGFIVYGLCQYENAALHEAVRGVSNAPLFVERAGSMCVLASRHDTALLQQTQGSDLEAMATAYHDCVNELSAAMDILPMRFGSVFPDVEKLQAFLRTNEQGFLRGLAAIQGQQEWCVRCDLPAPEPSDVKPSPGAGYLRARFDERGAARMREDLQVQADRKLESALCQAGVSSLHWQAAANQPAALHLLWRRGQAQALLSLLNEAFEGQDGFELNVHGPRAPFSFAASGGIRDAA